MTARTSRRRLSFSGQLLVSQVLVVLLLGMLGLAAVTWLARSMLRGQYEQRALAVSRTIAADPGLADAVAREDQATVQRIAMAQQRATAALFVVVTDRRGIRLAHPNPQEVGKSVSTSPEEALHGREVADIEEGTLGLSARGKVPLRTSDGAVVGEVSVGFSADDIDRALLHLLAIAIPIGVGAVLVGASAAGLVARRVKRGTFGLEPREVADLVREREAVLHGIGEGVLAIDDSGRITMCNNEARRLLDNDLEVGALVSDAGLPERLQQALSAPPDRAVSASERRVLIGVSRGVEHDGRSLGAVLTLRDRTDIESLTDELASVRTMTSALRAQRHEFANRMHTVIGLLRSGSTADALEYLDESGAVEGTDHVSALDAVASNTIRALFSAKVALAAERGVVLELSEHSAVPHKLLAPVEVVTVLGNLLDNAIDAAAGSVNRPARVDLDLLEDGSNLVMSVADSGDGIAEQMRGVVFQEGLSTRGPDRGYGLAIARRTARDLSGDIEITSTGKHDAATVFVATLPGVLDAERSVGPKQAAGSPC